MGVEIDNSDRFRRVLLLKAEIMAKGDFMPSAQEDGEDAGLQQLLHGDGELLLGFFEVIVIAEDVSCIEQGGAAYDGEVGAGGSDGWGCEGSAGASLVSLDAFVAGKAQKGDAVGRHWRDGLMEVE